MSANRSHTLRRGAGRAALVALTLVALLVGCAGGPSAANAPTATTSPSATATPTTPAVATGTTGSGAYAVKVYFAQHPISDNDPSRVFAVNRVSPTLGVATYAIQQ
ncbi:MAG: hypothetical protein ACRDID_11005, partial [Ktedonobacterales bacterium]